MKFPSDFLWGASTSSYQIEGGNERSALWDWEKRKGWERSGFAANSWEDWRKDIECLKELNLKAYRFSVEWSRVEPEPGAFDAKALDRYKQLAACLNEAGIRPVVCLHHFSEPAWLFRELPEGWLAKPAAGKGALAPAAERFLEFVEKTVDALLGEVEDWLTFNEPMAWLLWGYGVGHFPPGKIRALTLESTFYGRYGGGGLVGRVAKAHAAAYRLIHAKVRNARVSIAQNIVDVEPAGDAPAHAVAVKVWDKFMHERLLDLARHDGALDFLGINYYTRIYAAKARLPLVPMGVLPGYAEVEEALGKFLFGLLGGRRGGLPRTDMGWEIAPEGLARVVEKYWRRYKLPILITENGLAGTTESGREEFLRSHLAALGRAMSGGVKVLGYLHWSLMDNYEWGSYRPKFGLFSVDRENGFKRSPAPGARYYAEVARTGEIA